jgi:hypothetical protein
MHGWLIFDLTSPSFYLEYEDVHSVIMWLYFEFKILHCTLFSESTLYVYQI